jgi:23S rRNA-/tRNA-specific pseudouridylate synthase
MHDVATQRVRRVSRGRRLAPGTTLLLPKSVLEANSLSSSSDGRSSSTVDGRGTLEDSRLQQKQGQARPAADQRGMALWTDALRASLLHADPDFLAINKPPGLPCQGGSGLMHSIDVVADAAFADLLEPHHHRLRLVHRLDLQTSGVLLLATRPDSAAWLAAAFRDSSEGHGVDGHGQATARNSGSGRAATSGGARLRKTYWAAVAISTDGGGAEQLRRKGSISLPVPARQGSSSERGGTLGEQPALTRFKVLRSNEQLAWLELQPATGRKHQLRYHCAQGLGTPVLGDPRYGEVRSQWQAALLADVAHRRAAQVAAGASEDAAELALREASAKRRQGPMFLHCRRLVVQKPGGQQVTVTAPLPPLWRVLLAQQDWPLPHD